MQESKQLTWHVPVLSVMLILSATVGMWTTKQRNELREALAIADAKLAKCEVALAVARYSQPKTTQPERLPHAQHNH